MKSFHQRMNDLRDWASALEANRQPESARCVRDDIEKFIALRDQFALAALTGLLADTANAGRLAELEWPGHERYSTSDLSYVMADAMLAARDIDTSKGVAA